MGSKIVIALDAFKGGMTAPEVCAAVARGLRAVDPDLQLCQKPMADGGEGTAAALLSARKGGEWIPVRVKGSLPGQDVEAGYAWFPDTRCAVVEMAVANGLPLLRETERDPLQASTFGSGELIRAATRKGAERILFAIGGSATIDGGTGAAMALGGRFLNAAGTPVPLGGGHLGEIAQVVAPANTTLPPISVLCDVTNPLCGEEGAAVVFGPQKGATETTIPIFDEGLRNLARVVRRCLGVDIERIPGAGAAGGLGGGAVAFMNATLSPGIDTLMKVSGLHDALSDADWAVTGEGSFDNQSLDGKVVSGVARLARAAGVPVVVMAGRVLADSERFRRHGIVEALPTHAPEMPMAEVLRREAELLEQTAADWWRRRLDFGLAGIGNGKTQGTEPL